MVSEVDKLWDRLEQEGVTHFHVSLTESCTVSPEEIAAELNRLHEHMSDPVNAQIARIEGRIFLKSDTVYCIKNRHTLVDGEFIANPPTREEQHRLASLEEDIKLLRDTVDLLRGFQSNG